MTLRILISGMLSLAAAIGIAPIAAQSIEDQSRADRAAGIVGGEAQMVVELLREFYKRNLTAHPVEARPVWLAEGSVRFYDAAGQRLQLVAYRDAAEARRAKLSLVKRLSAAPRGQEQPAYLAQCGDILALEFGEREAVLGAVTGLCEYPIDLRAMRQAERNRDLFWLVHSLRKRDPQLMPYARVSADMQDQGFGYRTGKSFLHLFPYPNVREAKAGQARFREVSNYGYDLTAKMFRCRSTIAIFWGPDPLTPNRIERLCGRSERPGIARDSGE